MREAMSAVCVLGVVGRGVVKNDKEHAITILHQIAKLHKTLCITGSKNNIIMIISH